jgi:hypothetical protein
MCEKPVHISELSYMPAHLTRLGRVNRPGSPVLYCSTSRNTPFFEARPKIGQPIAIVNVITTAPLLANHVGYTRTVFGRLASNREQAGWGGAPARVPGNAINQQVAEFLADAFTRPVQAGSEHLNKLPVAIAEKLFSDKIFDALLYPTVPMNANADNLAIKPRYADTYLQFVRAEFAQITALREFSFDVDVLESAGPRTTTTSTIGSTSPSSNGPGSRTKASPSTRRGTLSQRPCL